MKRRKARIRRPLVRPAAPVPPADDAGMVVIGALVTKNGRLRITDGQLTLTIGHETHPVPDGVLDDLERAGLVRTDSDTANLTVTLAGLDLMDRWGNAHYRLRREPIRRQR